MSRLDLINNILSDGTQIKRAIKQGNDYELKIAYLGEDISTAQFLGQIRQNTVDSEGLLLADFTFKDISYDSQNDKTLFSAFIAGEQTELIPYTKYNYTIDQFKSNDVFYPANPARPTTSATSRNCWFYDIKAIVNSREIGIIDYGLVQVLARYTED